MNPVAQLPQGPGIIIAGGIHALTVQETEGNCSGKYSGRHLEALGCYNQTVAVVARHMTYVKSLMV